MLLLVHKHSQPRGLVRIILRGNAPALVAEAVRIRRNLYSKALDPPSQFALFSALCVRVKTSFGSTRQQLQSEGIKHGRSLIAGGEISLVPDLAQLLLTNELGDQTSRRVREILEVEVDRLKEAFQLMSASWSKGDLWPFHPRLLQMFMRQTNKALPWVGRYLIRWSSSSTTSLYQSTQIPGTQ